MLLAVKAKRVTFISSASSGSAAASGSGVSITLHCCRSLRATTKSVDGIVFQLAYVAIFVGIAYFAVDQYRLWRERRVEAWRKDGHLPKPKGAAESGTNGKGELSTAAKYAIWNYMFSLFAVGGTIIGIV